MKIGISMLDIKNIKNSPKFKKYACLSVKAALEQAQALYGNVPGFEGTDLMKMHEKLM